MKRPTQRECYRVADLQIDVGAMRVWQSEREIRLPPLSFELLLLLVRRAPDVVTRDECMRTIWNNVVVGPETLKQRVKLLREVLRDDSRRPRYIETVRGRGYRLLPSVRLADHDPVDWPSRLRSRLEGLLGNDRHGGNRGGGTLVVAAIFVVTILSLNSIHVRDAASGAEGDDFVTLTQVAASTIRECPAVATRYVPASERRFAASG